MLLDLRFALRSLLRHRTVSLLVIACLGLVVAGNTTVFSITNVMLIRPFPFPEPERLAFVNQWERSSPDNLSWISPANFNDYRDRNTVFERLEGMTPGRRNLTGTGAAPEQLSVVAATPGLLSLAGAKTPLGRVFGEEDARPGASGVVVLTDTFWQRRFGADPDIVGRTILLDREPHEVIGVLNEDFSFINTIEDLWLPLVVDPASTDRSSRTISGVARLGEGVSVERARDEMQRIAAELETEHPDANRGWGAQVSTFRERFPGKTDRILFSLLQAAGLFTLLIACANIANLLMARGQVRSRELALRSALGAGRRRIVRQLLTESLVLSFVGGVVGLGLGVLGVRTLRALIASELPRGMLPVLDQRVILFSLSISALAGLIFGLTPSLQATGSVLSGALREGGGGAVGASRRWLTNAFVVAEVAFALALLTGSGLLMKSVYEVQYADPGFDGKGVLTFRLALPESDYPTGESQSDFRHRLLSELRSLPGVESTTAALTLPRSRNTVATFVEPEDLDLEGQPKPVTNLLTISPGYLSTMRIPLLQGRGFEAMDRADAPKVAVVDRAFAERFWPNADPIARRILIRGEEREIVGLTKTVRQRRIEGIEGVPTSLVYLPIDQLPDRAFGVLVRVNGEPEQLADAVRETVWSLDANLPVAGVQSLDHFIDSQFVGARVLVQIAAGFGACALALAVIGVYGVLAYSVTRRTREIGVRMAMGARKLDVVGLVLSQGLKLSAIGILFGLPLVLGVGRLLAAALGPYADYPVYLAPAIALGLLATTALASYLPALRAASLPPTQALRAD